MKFLMKLPAHESVNLFQNKTSPHLWNRCRVIEKDKNDDLFYEYNIVQKEKMLEDMAPCSAHSPPCPSTPCATPAATCPPQRRPWITLMIGLLLGVGAARLYDIYACDLHKQYKSYVNKKK